MKFEIRNRWTNEVQVTAEIECDESTSVSVKLGLAVKWAVKAPANLTGANLTGADLTGAYLTGANLTGANLTGAYLTGAYLTGAYLTGAYLAGANLAGVKIKRLVTIVQRMHEPYQFTAWDTDQGVRIVAGCRNFSPEEYRAHVAATYPDAPKAEETLAIIAFIEARAAALEATP